MASLSLSSISQYPTTLTDLPCRINAKNSTPFTFQNWVAINFFLDCLIFGKLTIDVFMSWSQPLAPLYNLFQPLKQNLRSDFTQMMLLLQMCKSSSSHLMLLFFEEGLYSLMQLWGKCINFISDYVKKVDNG